jgi:cytochrome c peroxidase
MAALALVGCDAPEAGAPLEAARDPAAPVVALQQAVAAAPAVAITPRGGLFHAAPTVTLAASPTGAAIFYTDDGTDPATSATRKAYAGPFALEELEEGVVVAKSAVVKAIAVGAGATSPVAEAIFIVTTRGPAEGRQLQSLKDPDVRRHYGPPSNLGDFVRDGAKLVALGKALFWDMQVGSDGVTACASCHFNAGADSRAKNQLSPGLAATTPDTTFQLGGPNYTLRAEDFPLRRLADPNDRRSRVLFDTNDVVSSQGVFAGTFLGVDPGSGTDRVDYGAGDPVFNVRGVQTRRVEPRNTPSVINAVLAYRSFWDGRAQHEFNGVNPFGKRDKNAKVAKVVSDNRKEVDLVSISLDRSALASQAVGPVLSPFEMSGADRTFPDVGLRFARSLKRKWARLSEVRPLGKQRVSPTDSVLAGLVAPDGKGLSVSYRALVEAAFKPEWWNANDKKVGINRNGEIVSLKPGNGKGKKGQCGNLPPGQQKKAGGQDPCEILEEFSVMEWNFSLFFGLAVQAYEATLVSDDTPYDRFLQEERWDLLGDAEKRGLVVFQGKGKCINCHGGAELTNASVRRVRDERIEKMVMGNGGVAVYDNGFYNVGVRPTAEDVGVGGLDPFGNPLSMSGLAKRNPGDIPPNKDDIRAGDLSRIAVDGAFKTPALRNVALTAPYFHNGGQLTLRQVVDFYNRGADFHDENLADLDPDVERLHLSEGEKNDLVAFLRALTDARVVRRSAPFDHPELFLTNGHPGDQHGVTSQASAKASDGTLLQIREVGRDGGDPLPSFLGLAP